MSDPEKRRARARERDKERTLEFRTFLAQIESANLTRETRAKREARLRKEMRKLNLDLIQEL